MTSLNQSKLPVFCKDAFCESNCQNRQERDAETLFQTARAKDTLNEITIECTLPRKHVLALGKKNAAEDLK